MTVPDQLLFNPLDPAFRVDPYPSYARLRAEAPAYHLPNGVWVISRYADCLALLKNPRVGSDARKSNAYKAALGRGRVDFDDEVLGQTPPFLVLDPPDHTRLRALVSRAFTPRAVEAMRPHVESIVNDLLDQALRRGGMDVIEEFAYPLPLTVICDMLGVPSEDHGELRGWSRALSRGLDPPEVLSPDAVAARKEAGNAFADYFARLIAERRVRPGDDLLSALIAAREQEDELTEEELISTCIFLLAAGHETTVNLIGNGMLAFLRHQGEYAKLREDPGLAASLVEEVLRYDAPVQYASRTALDVLEVAGEVIAAGDQMLLLLGSANRDDAQFVEPDRFDIARGDSRHLAFGFGVHFCMGAPLARLEGESVFRMLAERVQRLRSPVRQPEYREHIVNRGLRTLPVSFE